jgi:hypothetical protein
VTVTAREKTVLNAEAAGIIESGTERNITKLIGRQWRLTPDSVTVTVTGYLFFEVSDRGFSESFVRMHECVHTYYKLLLSYVTLYAYLFGVYVHWHIAYVYRRSVIYAFCAWRFASRYVPYMYSYVCIFAYLKHCSVPPHANKIEDA